MAKSGFKMALKGAKKLNKVCNQIARDSERKRKNADREAAKEERERQKWLREQERDEQQKQRALDLKAKQDEKNKVYQEKMLLKAALVRGQKTYEERCKNRATVREQYIEEALK